MSKYVKEQRRPLQRSNFKQQRPDIYITVQWYQEKQTWREDVIDKCTVWRAYCKPASVRTNKDLYSQLFRPKNETQITLFAYKEKYYGIGFLAASVSWWWVRSGQKGTRQKLGWGRRFLKRRGKPTPTAKSKKMISERLKFWKIPPPPQKKLGEDEASVEEWEDGNVSSAEHQHEATRSTVLPSSPLFIYYFFPISTASYFLTKYFNH